jgi:hypothetical protein
MGRSIVRRSYGQTVLRLVAALGIGVGMLSTSQAQSYISDNNRGVSAFHFAASKQQVAFPVPVERDAVGLVVIDRASGKQRLIFEEKAFLLYPRFSDDGKRLLFVRNEAHANERKLIVCAVETWRCRTWLSTTATIRSPLELDQDTILYSSSPVDKRPDGKPLHNKHDFYLLSHGAQAERLSDFRLQELDSLNVVGARLVFEARTSPAEKKSILDEVRKVGGPGSEIYALDFNQARRKIQVPTQPLKPLVLIEGYSTNPATGPDEKLAFLNRRTKGGKTHFNLAVAASRGQVERYFEASGWAFSRPVFVGKEIVANEIFDRHYEVKSFDESSGKSKIVAKFEYIEAAIRTLERISLTIE